MVFRITFSNRIILCPFCGSNKIKFAYYSRWKTNETSNSLCFNCFSIFQNPPLTEISLKSIYDSPTYWDNDKGNRYVYSNYIDQEEQYVYESRRRLLLILEALKTNNLKNKNILMIGCGPGFESKVLLNAGANVLGIEPSREMADFARKKFGLKVSVGMFEEITDLAQNSFDLVVTWGTSMNFLNPGIVYAKASLLLKPGGSLFFDFFDMAGPFHFLTYRKRKKAIHVTSAPSKEGITELLRKSNFNKIHFIKQYPYYSLSLIASQLDIQLFKWVSGYYPFKKIGMVVPFPGVNIVRAVKT